MLRFMLDTNICIYTIKNRPDGVPVSMVSVRLWNWMPCRFRGALQNSEKIVR